MNSSKRHAIDGHDTTGSIFLLIRNNTDRWNMALALLENDTIDLFTQRHYACIVAAFAVVEKSIPLDLRIKTWKRICDAFIRRWPNLEYNKLEMFNVLLRSCFHREVNEAIEYSTATREIDDAIIDLIHTWLPPDHVHTKYNESVALATAITSLKSVRVYKELLDKGITGTGNFMTPISEILTCGTPLQQEWKQLLEPFMDLFMTNTEDSVFLVHTRAMHYMHDELLDWILDVFVNKHKGDINAYQPAQFDSVWFLRTFMRHGFFIMQKSFAGDTSNRSNISRIKNTMQILNWFGKGRLPVELIRIIFKVALGDEGKYLSFR
jgi:hypothetical protein